ncbi:MAG: hypothetical protein JW874_00820 [Spirochaetales bacterium]|nr:hypothetical protein [Spirochaetales bacterium]
MKKRTMDILGNLYDRDPETGAFIIRMSIEHYTDIFNELDPSPLRKRDLDPAFLDYLNECSSDIPLKYRTILQINCPHKIRDEKREARVRTGIMTYCNYMMLKQKDQLTKSLRKAVTYILVFIILMSLAIACDPLFKGNVITGTLLAGFSIGGWVFLWEAIVLLAFENRKTRSDFRRYERMIGSEVIFAYY